MAPNVHTRENIGKDKSTYMAMGLCRLLKSTEREGGREKEGERGRKREGEREGRKRERMGGREEKDGEGEGDRERRREGGTESTRERDPFSLQNVSFTASMSVTDGHTVHMVTFLICIYISSVI